MKSQQRNPSLTTPTKTESKAVWEDDLEGEIILIKRDREKALYRLRKILDTKRQQIEIMCSLLTSVSQSLDKWEEDERISFKKKDAWFLMQTLMHFSMSREHLELLKKEWDRRKM